MYLHCFYYFLLFSFFSLGNACNSSASLCAFDIADGFVRQLPKMSSFLCRTSRILKLGWAGLNPRVFSNNFLKLSRISKVITIKKKRIRNCQDPTCSTFSSLALKPAFKRSFRKSLAKAVKNKTLTTVADPQRCCYDGVGGGCCNPRHWSQL